MLFVMHHCNTHLCVVVVCDVCRSIMRVVVVPCDARHQEQEEEEGRDLACRRQSLLWPSFGLTVPMSRLVPSHNGELSEEGGRW